MTGYTIRPGYNYAHQSASVARELVAVVADLRMHPERIASEVARLEPGFSAVEVADFAALYREQPAGDGTLRVMIEDGVPVITQVASGVAELRAIKCACRRAFIRLVVDEMHRRGMEVDVAVA